MPTTTAGRLALFDLDNTLIDRDAAFRAWCDAFSARHKLGNGAVDLLIEADRNGHAPRSEVFGALVMAYRLAESPAEIEAIYRQEYPLLFVPDPVVNHALSDLRRRGWKLVIVTNGPPSQVAKIERTGLDAVVDGWCISDVVGSAKPDRGIFEAAARVAGAPLDGWMVGDTAEADVVGARAVGLRTIWISRGRSVPRDPLLRADVIVDSIEQAFSTIAAAELRPLDQ